ncbi:hypothetical protein [Nocardia sp. NPDC004711]
MPFLTFLLCLGAAARLTRLVTDDYITRHLRTAVITRTGHASDLSWLVTCAWCFGMWCAAAVFTAGYLYGDQPWFIWPAAALSASHLIGLGATHLDGDRS